MIMMHKAELATLVQTLHDAQQLLSDAYARDNNNTDAHHKERWALVHKYRREYWPDESGPLPEARPYATPVPKDYG